MLFSFILLTALSADSCGSVQKAREFYARDEFAEAVSILWCRVEADSNDVEALRLLSDIYWWEGKTEKSAAIAQRLRGSKSLADDEALMFHTQKRLAKFDLGVLYEHIFGSNQESYLAGADVGYRYWKRNEVRYSFVRDSRQFSNGPLLVDHLHQISHTAVFPQRVYLQSAVSACFEADFSSRVALELEPHYVFRHGSDVGFGIKWSDYKSSQDVITFRPSWSMPLFDRWLVGLRSDFTVRPTRTLSVLGIVETYWFANFFSRALGGGGKGYEGDGLVDKFYTLAGGVGYQFMPSKDMALILELMASLYRGDIRDDNRIGGGVRLSF